MSTSASLQADPSSSEPQLDNAVAGPPVPALPAAHAVPAAPAPAEPPSLPADAGDAAGGGVLTAREERRKVCDPLVQAAHLNFTIVKLHASPPLLLSRQQYDAQPCFSSHIICSTLADRLMPLG